MSFETRPVAMLLSLLLGYWFAPSVADANIMETTAGEEPEPRRDARFGLLSPADFRLFINPAVGLNGAGLLGEISSELRYRVFKRPWAPAVGVMANGQYFRRRGIAGGGFEFGALLSWDLHFGPAKSLAFSPTAVFGYGLWRFRESTYHFFDLQVGASLRISIARSWEVVVRPARFDLLLDGYGVAALYKGALGLGYRF
ncbi:MAG TPA: hypothetical protein ENJ18_16225 [Nannocystis exedens]|nr:hypothetical protein [Nannocystis exedens]